MPRTNKTIIKQKASQDKPAIPAIPIHRLLRQQEKISKQQQGRQNYAVLKVSASIILDWQLRLEKPPKN